MTPEEWWLNFGLGIELDLSGSFIYNGIKHLDSLDGLNNPADIFEILYNLSVGLERLLKVAIILNEYNSSTNIVDLEESLITHNTSELANRINTNNELDLSVHQKEFLSLLSKFYKSQRYGRYSITSIYNVKAEKYAFLQYIEKHLKVGITNELVGVQNTDQIKKFIGKIVGKISRKLYSIIYNKASKLNIYTYELRGDSKAIKVFLGLNKDRLDFLDEMQIKRELIMFLIDEKSGGAHFNMMKSFGALDLDPARLPAYIKALLNDIHLPDVEEEVEVLYEELSNIQERFQKLNLIDCEYLGLEEDF
ncbi:MAG: hypothetical protein HQL54_02795 [Magnetococcales bacterium]|nr:hypothetical protein [Magnetococcales bacterium]